MSITFHTLDECASLVRDNIHPRDAKGMPYIGLEHIEEGQLHLKGHGWAEDVTSAKLRFRKGDILFGKLRPYFRKVIRAPFDGVCSTDIWVVQAKPSVVQDYIFYWMASEDFVNFANSGSIGTRMPRAKWEHAAKHKQQKIALSEQRTIARILGALDDKIEVNRKMNETLESIAQAIFQSWFVDFDPVHAKSKGHNPGLPREIATLFPSEFEDSSLGPIPKGWKVSSLSNICAVNPSRTLKRGENAPYLDMKNMPTSGPCPTEVVDRKFTSGSRFENGDTLLARITPCLEKGKTAYMQLLADQQIGWGSTEFIIIRPRAPIPPIFAYYLARSDRFRSFAIQRMTGSSGRQRVPPDSLSRFYLAVPPDAVFIEFGKLLSPAMARSHASAQNSQHLSRVRNFLLPKLLSGKLRAGNTE